MLRTKPFETCCLLSNKRASALVEAGGCRGGSGRTDKEGGGKRRSRALGRVNGRDSSLRSAAVRCYQSDAKGNGEGRNDSKLQSWGKEGDDQRRK